MSYSTYHRMINWGRSKLVSFHQVVNCWSVSLALRGSHPWMRGLDIWSDPMLITPEKLNHAKRRGNASHGMRILFIRSSATWTSNRSLTAVVQEISYLAAYQKELTSEFSTRSEGQSGKRSWITIRFLKTREIFLTRRFEICSVRANFLLLTSRTEFGL